MAKEAADAIFAKNGTDIVLLDVERSFLLSDVFVIATGRSRPHVQSLAEHVEERLADHYAGRPNAILESMGLVAEARTNG